MTHGLSGYVQGCRCEVCAKATVAYKHQRLTLRYNRGMCRYCPDKRLETNVACKRCLTRFRIAQRERRALQSKRDRVAA